MMMVDSGRRGTLVGPILARRPWCTGNHAGGVYRKMAFYLGIILLVIVMLTTGRPPALLRRGGRR